MLRLRPAPWFIPRLVRDKRPAWLADVSLSVPVERPPSLLRGQPRPWGWLSLFVLLVGLGMTWSVITPSPVPASLVPHDLEVPACMPGVPRILPQQHVPPGRRLPEDESTKVHVRSQVRAVPPRPVHVAPLPEQASITTDPPRAIPLEDLGLLPIPAGRAPSAPDTGSHG